MTTISPSNWTQHYEDLRAHNVGSMADLGPPAWGMVLLVQQGVRGWMRAWQDPLRASRAEPRPASAPQAALTNTRETTLLLANMAMRSLASSP